MNLPMNASVPAPVPTHEITSQTSFVTSRAALRSNLLARREAFVTSPAAADAETAMAVQLRRLLIELEPETLGLYWPMRCEFNAPAALREQLALSGVVCALTYAKRKPVEMHYRRWDGAAPSVRDECNMVTADGPMLVPDLVLVPCVGYTTSGHRMGYGGGYFDRWLAANPHVTSIGVAWAATEISEAEFAAQAHDQVLSLVVTENGVV
jgi:5-formyltetrahydrofolate cyclo-ligase